MIFLTFSSYLIATQEQPVFDAIYNLMKDAQQWRTQFLFYNLVQIMNLSKLLQPRKFRSPARKGNQAAENMAGRARSFYSIIICL